MATSNRDRVGRVLDILREALGPYVLREYKMAFKKEFAREIDAALTTNAYELPREALQDETTLQNAIDVHGWLNLMWRRWNDVFARTLGHAERSYVSELMEFRNAWAHQNAFTNDEAYRVADTAERLLKSVGMPEYAERVNAIASELLRLRFEQAQARAKKDTGPLKSQEEMTTKPGLKPWRDVIMPHPDVATGKYLQATFVADLAQVIEGRAEPEYQDPVEFFRRTYLTEGLLKLLANGLRRLTASGGDPVVQLKTAFGGGKTHSMLALYHIAGSGVRRLADFPGGDRIRETLGEDIDLPEANRAVLVGTALSATNGQAHPEAGLTTHTLWGEMAYQLGGLEGYEMVRVADENAVSPGANVLLDLLNQFGPCLVIIDEFVAYARNIYGKEGLPCGTFDSLMTFVQEMTEAAKRSTDSMLLISIPESDIEKGGQSGHIAADYLEKVIGRMESVWTPVTATESFEIVRRRLFNELTPEGYAARDAVVSEFGAMYRASKGDFPAETQQSDYLDRMKAAYPIHPELFERLYQDWSTLEKFQRTRGVLRLMAAVIHQLWQEGDASLLIMPGTLPLHASTVKSELLRYLPEGWATIVDADVDGPDSRPTAQDNDVPTLGKYRASRRVARAIFVGSAPTVAAQKVRGVEEVRVRLATVQPGEPPAIFGDALRRLNNRLMYLFSDGSRYWYDTHPTVNRLARDRAQHIPEEDVVRAVHERLRAVRRQSNEFAGAHVAPASSADVPDEQRVRVVVLGIDFPHKRTNAETPALEVVRDFFEHRGSSPRLYRNMLVFIAPDERDARDLMDGMREFMAWRSIRDEEEQLNLDAQQRRQVETHLKRADEMVESRVRSAYSWLIVPSQPDPQGELQFDAHRITGEDSFYTRAFRRLEQNGEIILTWAPMLVRKTIDDLNLWQGRKHLGLKEMWDYLTRYCYMPRLLDRDVLHDAVAEGVRQMVDTPFGYADRYDEATKRYERLLFGSSDRVYFNDSAVLVHPDAAREQIEVVVNPPDPPPPDGPDVGGSEPGPQPPTPSRYTRYHGTVELNAQRVASQVEQIVEEILQHLTSLQGSEVRVSLDIQAFRPEGFDEQVMRTVSENSKTLKFGSFGFEQD
ncbi:MAG: Swt1 family HEPN domain-containing protein [Anaerolineae bacterium]